jgi:hypothetical protein
MGKFELPKIEPPLSPSENYAEAAISKIRTIEGNLKADEALSVYCQTADGRMRVSSLQITGGHIIFVIGSDDSGVECCHISASSALQLTCKVTKVAADTKRSKIGFDVLRKS